MGLVLSGSVRHFDVTLLWKFKNHDNFALTVPYPPSIIFTLVSSTNRSSKSPPVSSLISLSRDVPYSVCSYQKSMLNTMLCQRINKGGHVI